MDNIRSNPLGSNDFSQQLPRILTDKEQKDALISSIGTKRVTPGVVDTTHSIKDKHLEEGPHGEVSQTIQSLEEVQEITGRSRVRTQEEVEEYERMRGPREPTIAFAGYDTAKLQEIQHYLEDKELLLNVCPKRPEKSYPLKRDKFEKFKEEVQDPIQQKLLTKVVDNVQHITIEQLDSALKSCVQQLNDKLELKAQEKYSVAITPGKSNQWVAGLALKDLKFLPASCCSLGKQGATANVYVPESEWKMAEYEHIIVLFDDCAYSGSQMGGNLRAMLDELKNRPEAKIYLVTPFMTQFAYENLTKLSQKWKNVHLEVITTETRINRTIDVLTKTELDILRPLCDLGMENRTLCYTDWRYPDGVSFEQGFGSDGIEYPELPEFAGVKVFNKAMRIAKREKEKEMYYFLPSSKDIPRPYAISSIQK